ncbi:MAG: methyltransferase domain-containing protein, partial [Elusimicrobiota bacterium]
MEKKNIKIGICVPLYNVVPASFFVNFINRLHELYDQNKYDVQIYMRASTIVDKARNDLVKMALKDNCDYVFFVDSDTIIPKGAVDALLNMNVDIASGLYFSKGKPYLPVARVKEGERHFFLEDFEFNQIIEVQGVGMGCCIINTKVFKDLKFPYFKLEWREFEGKPYQIAEDLYFCDEAIKAGFKVWLNTGVICNHFGVEVGPEQFMIYKENLKQDKIDREEMIEDLMEFEGKNRKKILSNFLHRHELRAEEMKKYDMTDPKQVFDYYVNNQWEIYDHLEWHFKGRRSFDKNLLAQIKQEYPDRATEILDFGCNAGQMAYMLAKEKYIVTVAEPNKKARDFMSFRFKKHKLKIKFLEMPVHERFKNQFDIILCFDVLEHIHDDEFDKTIELIKRLKKPEGRV